ncbi:kanadaptin [Mantella aurantiaca]
MRSPGMRGPGLLGPGAMRPPGMSRPGADEGPRRTEGPDAREEHEVPGADEGPPAPRDLTAEQRDAGGADEGPHVPGPPQQRLPQQRHPFKKPVAPGRPGGGHEKGVEAGGQPAAQPPVLPDGQAAPHVGLPPDAQRAPPALPYGEPAWAGRPRALYSLEVLKGGAILSSRDLSHVSCTVFGRLPACHVPLEHPSVSRYHAVLQYRSVPGDGPGQERGFYVYDLGSTHGTFVNKHRVPSKEYCRVRVGHVVKFGGSTRLFILQGPEEDQEAESELTVTQIKEERRHRETLQKRMLGDDSDEEDEPAEEEKSKQAASGGEAGCMWGMGEDAMEEESEENPIALEFQEEREALYLKNPKKALQGFFDREGEELEFEYEERCPGSWICRVKLPADDSSGKQLVAEISHSGKKKEAANLCSLEACRMLEMRGLLRQEAVSRKRKAKKWEDEDFYDSDDDTFLDRTGVVEKKRLNRMKKAGKIDEKPETLESLTSKLDVVEKEILEVAEKLRTCQTGVSQPLAQDSLDAFMTEMRAGISMDSVSRKKLHLQSVELRKEQQRLKSLIRIVQPTRLPELCANQPDSPSSMPSECPPIHAMCAANQTPRALRQRLPPKRTDLPASLFIMKSGDEPEEEDEDEDHEEDMKEDPGDGISEDRPAVPETSDSDMKSDPATGSQTSSRAEDGVSRETQEVVERRARRPLIGQEKSGISKPAAETPRRMYGPSKPPEAPPTAHYPEDDPDYCVWTPPAGQSGDGKTHLNEKYGY